MDVPKRPARFEPPHRPFHAPEGDSDDAVKVMLNSVEQRILALVDELEDVAKAHYRAAPASSLHVLGLNALIANAVANWIMRWPQ